MATIRRTGGADFPDKLKALVTGPAKSGKTTLLGTVPNIIIADTEPKANNLASLAHLDVPYVTIESSADLRELLMILANDSLRQQAAAAAGMTSVDAVAIDTFDTFQKILKRERMVDQKTTKFLRDDWSWMKEEMTKIVEAFTALPLHVIFTVHMGSKNIGTEDNPNVKVQPGLEGAIAQELPGMVGYSLRSFRKEEVDEHGVRFTKYWLQAEGDETYDFLGTRTAGRLPAYIDPDFGTIYQAAMSGRPTQQVAPVQTAGQTQPTEQQPQPAEQPAEQPAQQAGPDSGPAQQSQQAPETSPPPAERPADSEPINDAAMQHVKRVYDGLGLAFPEAKLRQITVGQARQVVMMWQAVQQDYAQGKGKEGGTAQLEMTEYLMGVGLMPDGEVEHPPHKQIEPKLGGTIDEAKAWVGDGSNLARVQEAYEFERTNKVRTSLMSWLESKGAGAPAEGQGAQPDVQTGVQTAPPEGAQPAAEPVSPAGPDVDASPTEEQAVQAIQEGLGGEVIEERINPDASCEGGGDPHQIDDIDIAKLSTTRFQKRLCVKHYIEHTRA